MCVGHNYMKVLNFLAVGNEIDNSVMSFHLKSDDFSKLVIKSFESIEIKITDLEGNNIGMDKSENIPTIVNIVLVNL